MINILKANYFHLSYWSATWHDMPGRQKKIFRVVMLIQFVVSLIFIFNQGVNSDEGGYVTYALVWAKGQPERTVPLMYSKTPMVAFSLIAAFFKQWLPESLLASDHAFYLKAGRLYVCISVAGLLRSILLACTVMGC